MKRLSPEARSMLAEYRAEQTLASAERQRMAHALAQRLANGPPALELDAEPPRLPLDSIAPRALSSHAKSACVALGIGLAIVGVGRFVHVQSARVPRTTASPATTSAPRGDALPPTAAPPAPPFAAPIVAEPRAEVNGADRLLTTVPSRTRVRDGAHAQEHPRRPAPARGRIPAHVAPVARHDELADVTALEPTAPAPPRAGSASVAAAADSQPVPETHAPQRTTTMVDDELLLLRRAQAALRAGDPKRALMQLAEHRWRFPNGQLADSREVARMLALCANGDRQLVRAEASDFLAAHPHSPFAQRVRAICAEPQR